MQQLLGIIIAKLLDPIGLIICFIAIKCNKKRSWYLQILIATVSSGVITETFLSFSQITRDWGDGLHISLFGGLSQSFLMFALMELKSFLDKRSKKK